MKMLSDEDLRIRAEQVARPFSAATDAVELAGYVFRELTAVRDAKSEVSLELLSECIDRAPLDPESKTELLGDIWRIFQTAEPCPFCRVTFSGDHAQNECQQKRLSEGAVIPIR